MAASIRIFPFHRDVTSPADEERQALMSSLQNTRTLINQAYSCFNATHDEDLIESYVFEINSLQARYNYLLRRVKALEETP